MRSVRDQLIRYKKKVVVSHEQIKPVNTYF